MIIRILAGSLSRCAVLTASSLQMVRERSLSLARIGRETSPHRRCLCSAWAASAVSEKPASRRTWTPRRERTPHDALSRWPGSHLLTSTWELHDAFTFVVIVALEDYGFCKKGEGGAFVEDSRIELGGELPVNTHGGHLSQAAVGGMLHITEAAVQLRRQ